MNSLGHRQWDMEKVKGVGSERGLKGKYLEGKGGKQTREQHAGVVAMLSGR